MSFLRGVSFSLFVALAASLSLAPGAAQAQATVQETIDLIELRIVQIEQAIDGTTDAGEIAQGEARIAQLEGLIFYMPFFPPSVVQSQFNYFSAVVSPSVIPA